MKIKLIIVGKESAEVFDEAIEQYTKKLKFYIGFETVVVPYLKKTAALSVEEQKLKEGELILKKIESQDYVVLLDEHGKQKTSVAFADFIRKQMNSSIKNLVFVVGGPYGFSQQVYERGNEKLSLSLMTFPHMMSRLIFIEQLYRAFTIIKGEPYHHE